jgi:hypothetical protein
MAYNNMYEQGGIVGPNRRQGLVQALSGGAPQMPDVPLGAFSDGPSYVQALEQRAKNPALQAWGKEMEARANGPRPFTDQIAGTFGPGAGEIPGASVAPQYGKTVGKYGSALEGYDSGKLNSGHASPKYLIGRTLSNFDPRQGVTPEVLAALNSLGIGQFSGSKDKVQIANGDPRFEGVNAIDLVRGFNDPNSGGGWQFGAEGGPSQAAAPQAGGLFKGSSIPQMLQGDASAGIQQALANIGGLSNPSRIQQLIAALSGGQ